jgi:UDP-GlcNAc:undecaprenyl-phosphate/decaprenyl-phosphate GlcNAc-1-phosphate transferase
MNVAFGLFCGFLASRLVWLFVRETLHSQVFLRNNYRKHSLPTAGGLVYVLSLLIVEAIRACFGALGIGDTAFATPTRLVFLGGAVGFGLLGLLDDLAAEGSGGGFRGHLRSLSDGRLTTGGIKLIGGGALALVLAGPAGGLGGADRGPYAFGWLLIDALVIALCANLANLFDRAPGRVTKVSALCFAALLVAAVVSDRLGFLAGGAVIFGAAIALLYDDLHEHVMVGDTGANILGATVGISVVLVTSRATHVFVLAFLLALNTLSELVSFSAVIDRVGVLRTVDRLGALPARKRHQRVE